MPQSMPRFIAARAECEALLWPTFALEGDPPSRFKHMFELSKDPLTKPDLGWADVGSVNLVSYDPATGTIRNEDDGRSAAILWVFRRPDTSTSTPRRIDYLA